MAASEVSKRIIMITSREGHTHAHDFLFVCKTQRTQKRKESLQLWGVVHAKCTKGAGACYG